MSSFKNKGPRHLPWSKSEIKALRSAVNSGLPLDCIEIGRRSAIAIRYKVSQLKLKTGTRWSVKETDKLRHAIERGRAIRDIEIINPVTHDRRSINSIRVKAVRLGIKEPRRARQCWTQKEISLLKKLRQDGLTPQQIKDRGEFGPGRVTASGRALPERSFNAIVKMIQRLGLVDQAISERTSEGRLTLNSRTAAQLDTFIR